MAEGWKASGFLKGLGIPPPSGQYRVGCVDLMHQLEGDDKGLLVRLHYPTQATPQAGYAYSLWYPHKNYIRGVLEVQKVKFPGLFSAMVGGLTGKGSIRVGIIIKYSPSLILHLLSSTPSLPSPSPSLPPFSPPFPLSLPPSLPPFPLPSLPSLPPLHSLPPSPPPPPCYSS